MEEAAAAGGARDEPAVVRACLLPQKRKEVFPETLRGPEVRQQARRLPHELLVEEVKGLLVLREPGIPEVVLWRELEAAGVHGPSGESPLQKGAVPFLERRPAAGDTGQHARPVWPLEARDKGFSGEAARHSLYVLDLHPLRGQVQPGAKMRLVQQV